MDKIKKDVNDYNREVVKELNILYQKLSNTIDRSYYLGKKTGYEEILEWLKQFQSQNKSNKYVNPKKFNNFLEKNNNNMGNKEDSKKKSNKSNINFMMYSQAFNNDNYNNGNQFFQSNIYPTSVENAFSNKNGNINLNNDINFFMNNSINYNNKERQNPFENLFSEKNEISSSSNNAINMNLNTNINNNYTLNFNSFNNNDNSQQDVQMNQCSPLRTNIINGNYNLKRKKNP